MFQLESHFSKEEIALLRKLCATQTISYNNKDLENLSRLQSVYLRQIIRSKSPDKHFIKSIHYKIIKNVAFEPEIKLLTVTFTQEFLNNQVLLLKNPINRKSALANREKIKKQWQKVRERREKYLNSFYNTRGNAHVAL